MPHRTLSPIIVAGALLAAGFAPLTAQDQRQMGSIGMSVYEDANFRGRTPHSSRICLT